MTYKLILVFMLTMSLSSCTFFDRPQERRYMNDFLTGKESCRNNKIHSDKGIYIRVVANTPATDSLYYAYSFRNGKINHYTHILSSRYPIDSLVKLVKKLETGNQKQLMNQGIYYCQGDTMYARNYYYDTHGLTIGQLIEDSRILIKAGMLIVTDKKKLKEPFYNTVNEQYFFTQE